MLITKEVEMRWSRRNKQWYIDKGYSFTKMKDSFIVKIKDLPNKSNVAIYYQCNNCNTIIKTDYGSYNRNTKTAHLCRLCNVIAVRTNSTGGKKISFEKVKNIFESMGYTLLSTKDDYKNSRSKLVYKCILHGKQVATYNSLQQGHGCPECGNDALKGENSHRWRGGVTELSEYLRCLIIPWKTQQFIRTGRTCELTGRKGNLNVHHMTSFSAIRDLTLEQLGLPIYKAIGEYTEDELRLVVNTFKDNNERLSNPIVMLESVHRNFHKFCGGYHKDTTMEQLEEFKAILMSKSSTKVN